MRTRDLWIRGLSMTSTSGVTKGIAVRLRPQKASLLLAPYYLPLLLAFLLRKPCFCFGCYFFGIIALAISGAEFLRVERLLLAFPDTPYKTCWSIFKGIWLLIKVPRYFFLLDSPSTRRGNRSLAFGCYCLSIDCTPCCQWLFQPHTLCCFWP